MFRAVALSTIITLGAATGALALDVITVNYPLAYMAERIGGELVNARYPGPVDEDPAFWQPMPGEITQFQNGDLIILNGAGYAKWVKNASLPRARTVVTTDNAKDRLIETEADSHSHGDDDEHSHGGLAFTTWLDFDLAAVQADAIAGFLARKDKDNAEAYDKGVRALKADFASLHTRAKALGPKLEGLPLLASHPIYQYFAEAYGLKIESLLWEPGVTPTKEQWVAFDALRANQAAGATAMLWEGEPSPETRERLEAQGLEIILFSQQSAEPDPEGFLEGFTRVLEALEKL